MKIVAEFSGGADSTAAVIIAKKRYKKAEIYPIFVDYGQVYAEQEFLSAKYLRKRLKIKPLKVVKIRGIILNKKQVYIPLRNLIIGSISASYADVIGADVIINGSKSLVVNKKDPYSFYDSTVPFYKMMECLVFYAREKKEVIEFNPILTEDREEKMSKKDVYKLILEEGIGLDKVWNCFFPTNGKRCNKCKNCAERNVSIKDLKC